MAHQKRKEFTIRPNKFLNVVEKKKLQTKAKEGDPSFTVELHVVAGNEAVEQAVLWFKKLDKAFILGKKTVPWDKMRGHLQALTKDKAQNVVTATYAKLNAIAKVVSDDYNRQANKDVF